MDINVATKDFIRAHRQDEVRSLALRYAGLRGDINLPFALDQIAGWQTARKKLPMWAATEGIIYPPHLSMEQCSSEKTARYKSRLAGSTLIDLTGGFGVDLSFMSRSFSHAVYVERNERLCAIAEHNFKALGLKNAEVVCGDAVEYLHSMVLPSRQYTQTDGNPKSHSSNLIPQTVIYLDPARRDANGHKVYGIEDCTPDVLALKDELLDKADTVMIKLSPMLDWHAATKAFGECCREVHILSVDNECKELLLVLRNNKQHGLLYCVDDGQTFVVGLDDVSERDKLCPYEECKTHGNDISLFTSQGQDSPLTGFFLYVPNASIMKAGVFSILTERFPVRMADKNSHLFISDKYIDDFPGRKFMIRATTSLNKHELKEKLGGIERANISVRNFPLSAVGLRKRLKLKDGGSIFLFATTMGGKHIILITEKLTQ